MKSDHARQDDSVITSFMERLRQQIEALLPEETVDTVLEQARSVLRMGLNEFELVGRHELDGHLAALEQLTQIVRDLERRIAKLEVGH